jgi:hypothetical protein
VLKKAKFVHLSGGRYCCIKNMEINKTIIVGRCPSQKPDSTIRSSLRKPL